MKLLSNTAALQIIDSVAIVLGQAMQLARARVASVGSSVLRMMAERDHAYSETELLRRELEIFRGQREAMRSHKRPDYPPAQRLAILQVMRLRSWNTVVTARRFVLHPNTVRAWVQVADGRREPGGLLGAPGSNKKERHKCLSLSDLHSIAGASYGELEMLVLA